MFSASSYLKFDIKQSKIGLKFAEQWLTKLDFWYPLMTADPIFSENAFI